MMGQAPFTQLDLERDDVKRVIRWFATPHTERDPPTQAALAREIGVQEETISAWKHNVRVKAAVREIIRTTFEDATPAVLEVIKRKALAGEQWAVDRFLSLIGGGEAVRDAHGGTSLTMTEAEATRIIARVQPAALGTGTRTIPHDDP